MSKVRADRYTNRADDGAPTFSQGVNVVGSGVSIGIGASVYSPEDNHLALGTGNAEVVRIKQNGYVGIGTNDPASELTVHNTADTSVRISCSGTGSGDHTLLRMKIGGNTASNYIYFGDVDDSNAGQIRYRHSTDDMLFNTLGVERLGIRSDGDISITDGNLVVASGHGIDFSATADGTGSNQDELLDDYETGNWTPVITSGATDVITYTGGNQYFRYIKVGKLVTLFFSLNNVTTAGNTGANCLISGLPFAADAGNTNNRFISGNVMFYNSGLTLSDWPVYAHHATGDTTINFYEKSSAGSNYNSVNVNTVGSGTYFFFSLQYYTS